MRRFVSAYENGVVDLNPFVHDYVVFGNTGDSPGWSTFDPRDYGMLPLSVMAVVCNNSVVRYLATCPFGPTLPLPSGRYLHDD